MRRPAILGGDPMFADPVPFARPDAPPLDRVTARVRPSYDRGILTNGPLVRELEERAAQRLGVDHVVAVASCTSGLMLAVHALRIEGSVVLPSFTFSASAHALVWNGLRPEFAECDPASFQIDVADAAARVTDSVGAVLATHVFGAPCPAEEVEKIAGSAGVPVVFDAAHAFGATRRNRPVGGFGNAEVFSLSPTKPVVAGEGGLVATDDGALAEAVRLGRDYGNPGDYNSRFAGLNARMSELHAATALESLADYELNLGRRLQRVERYRTLLSDVTGISLQAVDATDASTYKDFTIAVQEAFGVPRDLLVRALLMEGIDTRCYFSPPVHRHTAYARPDRPHLPVTEDTASRVVSLPVFGSLPIDRVEGIVEAIASVGANAGEVRRAASS